MEEVIGDVSTWQQQMVERTGRPGGQGPEGIISLPARRSFAVILAALKRLKQLLVNVGASDLLNAVSLPACATLPVERHIGTMQEQYGVPTVLQHALRAVDVVAEQVNREVAGFCYYTGNKGIYTPPNISAAGAQAEQQQQLLRQLRQQLSKPVLETARGGEADKMAAARKRRDLDDFINMYCRPVPQSRVRVHSKEQTGTLLHLVCAQS
jgi:hypothetical protein